MQLVLYHLPYYSPKMNPFRRFRTSFLLLAAATACSCSSLKPDIDEEDEDDGPPKLSERISNVDRSKQFDKKSLDIYEKFSDSPNRRYERSPFQGKRINKTDPVKGSSYTDTNRYNTERFNPEGATEQKKPRFSFLGERNKKQKTSRFMQKRSQDDGSERYATRELPDKSKVNALFGDRSERDISDRMFNTELSGSGTPAPTIIREPTQSEGDIRALLNGP